ncbi:sensor histidine kinase [Paenibacillus athensensis]|uniref:histidine kinase n=1 Tax=Paenibacillus athensensis TaxID=1967502 RepID=A0A4Y8Q4Q9_9BACL|nr:sensor histidine kinase [Paenibacillus athensensis]MCD1258470.1 sensor histidine kinase [Paenibacillus athensensis]
MKGSRIAALLAVFLLVALPQLPAAASPDASPEAKLSGGIQLDRGWEYRWSESDDWRRLQRLSEPPQRERRTSVWLKTRLPEQRFPEATLYVKDIEQSYEVFLDGRSLRTVGDVSGEKRFTGYELNLIPLDSDYAGKEIVFHIVSDYSQIGLFGGAELNSRSALIERMVRSDAVRIGFAFLYVLVGIFFMFLFLKDRQKAYWCFGFFLIFMGLWIVARTESRFLLWDAPAFWLDCRIYAIYLVPVFFVQFYECLLGEGYRKLSRRIWQLHLLYAVGAAVAVECRLVPIMNTLVPFDILLLLSILYTITFGIVKSLQGSSEAKIFSLGVITFALTSAYDILNTLGLVKWSQPISHWGLFIFVVSMVFILGRQFLRYGIIGATLNFRKEQMEQTMRAMTTGTAMMNHMIKNEITKINFLAGRIKDAMAERHYEQADRSVDSIFFTVQHLKEMVDKIKERTAEIHLNEMVCEVEALVEQAVSSVQPYLEQKNVELVRELKDKGILRCDPWYLSDAIVNICLNAVEAVEPGEGKIALKVWRSRKELLLEIRDNGCGIPEAYVRRVLEPFFSTKNRKDNHGLGLSYCYNVVRKHGGTLDIQSRVQSGTSVTIRLPAKAGS